MPGGLFYSRVMREELSAGARRGAIFFLTRVAVMTALAILARRFTPQISGLNLGGFPLVLSGLLLGPVGGAYVGGLSDITGMYLMPHGAFNPFFTCTAILTGALPPLFLSALYKRGGDIAPWSRLCGAIFLGQFCTKGVLFAIFFKLTTNAPIWVTLGWNTGVQLIHAPLYALLAHAILRALPTPLTAGGVRVRVADLSPLTSAGKPVRRRGPRTAA